MNLFTPLLTETRLKLDELIAVIDEVSPLPRRFRAGLKYDVAELSRLYTSGRGERGLSYLGRPNLLSAYLRYFLPWNVYRLCRLLPSLTLDLKDKDTVIDLGSGPLTFALALFLCRPELRSLPLEFLCLDRSSSVLEAGKRIFAAFAKTEAWKIRTLKGELSGKGVKITRKPGSLSDFNKRQTPGTGFVHLDKMLRGEKAALVVVINVFNEIFWDLSPTDREGSKKLAVESAGLLGSLCSRDGIILVVEPGIPRSGEFVSGLRSSFLEQGLDIISPCLHKQACPFPGGLDHKRNKVKWCHFSFDTGDAPPELLKLSADAGIPKERAVLSFLVVRKNSLSVLGNTSRNNRQGSEQKAAGVSGLRIISDPFSVGTSFGRYACSGAGAVLLRGSREKIENLDSGIYTESKITGQRDLKSGALIGIFPDN